MRLSPIVLRLRAANITKFGNNIAGAAELGLALDNTLIIESAFVVQTSEDAADNQYDMETSQLVTEVFSVIVALKNDTTQKDKTGITAYDSLFEVRKAILNSLLGWTMDSEEGVCIESAVEYDSGKLMSVNPAWLWYQFDFKVMIRVDRTIDVSGLDDFSTLATQYIMSPSEHIPLTGPGGLPVDTDLPDMSTWIDLTENLDDGAYTRGFGFGFDLYKDGKP